MWSLKYIVEYVVMFWKHKREHPEPELKLSLTIGYVGTGSELETVRMTTTRDSNKSDLAHFGRFVKWFHCRTDSEWYRFDTTDGSITVPRSGIRWWGVDRITSPSK